MASKLIGGHRNMSGKLKFHIRWPVMCDLVAKEACLSQENLKRRGINLCSKCNLCGKKLENSSHLFLHCGITDQLWQLFLNVIGITWIMPRSTRELSAC